MNNIKFISGFGNKALGVGIYIDDNLFSYEHNDRDFPDEESAIMLLVEEMANKFNVTIEKIDAHPCFRLTFYYDSIPDTIKQYKKDISTFYTKHQNFNDILEYFYAYHPTDITNEMNVINQVYELNGGHPDKFPEFYKEYRENFTPIFESSLWKDYVLASHNRTSNNDLVMTINDQLTNVWLERLEDLWNAPKDFEPYKKLWLKKPKTTMKIVH